MERAMRYDMEVVYSVLQEDKARMTKSLGESEFNGMRTE